VFEAQRNGDNVFVRAWAYNGLGILAQREPALRREIDELFERAMVTEQASVRARIRNGRKTW
jgi:HEAT repeat protein